MTWRDRLYLTAICGAGCFAWFRYPYQMASAILVLAVLGMLVLSVMAMTSGAEWVRIRTRKPLRGKLKLLR